MEVKGLKRALLGAMLAVVTACGASTTEVEFEVIEETEFAASLEAHLPAIYGVKAKLELVGEAAVDVKDAAVGLAGELAGSLGCAAQYGESFLAQLRASADVSVEVQASASASAEVSGSTSGG